ncbi:TetR/AcrR family transcriptional regulator [Phormidium sp. FACHB-322]|nr:TetR/AcrR family transcriptional regulator [Phormidium sp. FACHB-77]MBD2032923.1 TetR/AcrR family transcriptional regulator [Phormidium sp. FACHB-322]MBD2051671.1 TetR/AcrR family transcriptional regulator [Leptolyngbya sp. FACHB-60]
MCATSQGAPGSMDCIEASDRYKIVRNSSCFKNMTNDSHSSSSLRRQPKQRRGQQRVEKILEAAALVFDEVGYEAATTHQIAERAGTAIGSLYQFFPDKAAIFNAMELRHLERVQVMWGQANAQEFWRLPLKEMLAQLTAGVVALFEQPVSRVMFVQFYTARDRFQTIDDSLTQEAIAFLSAILHQRNPDLPTERRDLLAEVCVHSCNALILAALRQPDEEKRDRLVQQIPVLMAAYLTPYVGDQIHGHVMDVMICPHCKSQELAKNGRRRGKQCYLCKVCGKQFVHPAVTESL